MDIFIQYLFLICLLCLLPIAPLYVAMPTIEVTGEIIDTHNDVVSNGKQFNSIMTSVEAVINQVMIPKRITYLLLWF